MTLGATNREMRDTANGLRNLTLRVAILEGEAKAAFKRLLAWSISAAVVSSTLIYILFR